MEITYDAALESLHWILCSTTSLPDLYTKRCGGFKNEKEIDGLLRSNGYNTIDGGQILFIEKKNMSDENNILYYTVSSDSTDNYTKLYEKLTGMHGMGRLFFIQVGDSEWSTCKINVKDSKENRICAEIIKPPTQVFEFSEGMWNDSNFNEIKNNMSTKNQSVCKFKEPDLLNYMRDWNVNDITKIYCNRYVLDVELAGYKKNMMDFDSMIFHDGNYIAIESKEKDPIGKWIKKKVKGVEKEINEPDEAKWSFGWDTRRFAWYRFLKYNTGIDTWYLVREVDHQKSRNFVKWKKIDIDKFANCAVWHYERQTGRGSTVEVSYTAFDDLIIQ